MYPELPQCIFAKVSFPQSVELSYTNYATGAIIPKIETRMSTPDWYPNGYPGAESEMKTPEANPITFHVYPGKDNVRSTISPLKGYVLICGRLIQCTLTTAYQPTASPCLKSQT